MTGPTVSLPSDLVARTPRHAILLVAGRGSRLGVANTGDGPKPLVDVGGQSLFERQVRALVRVGVREILLVVGYRADAMAAAAAPLSARLGVRFTFVENPDFAETNTVVSQYLARGWMDRPVWCLNGDVLFAPELLDQLLATPGEAVLAIDVKRCGAEEVKVEVDAAGRVQRIGKQLDPEACLGEFVGVARYSAAAAAVFAQALVRAVEGEGRRTDYFEVALDGLGEIPLDTLRLHGAPMMEIDAPEDLAHARAVVVPRIDARQRTAPHLPASHVQEAIWRDHQRLPGTHLVSLAVRMTGAIDVARVARAFAAMVRKEPLMHSVWAEEGGRLRRRVDPDCIVPLRVASTDGPADLHARMAEEATRPIDVTQQASARGLLLVEGPGSAVLQVTWHHLAYDAVSVLRAMDDVLDALEDPVACAPVPDRFAELVAWEQRWLGSAECRRVTEELAAHLDGPLRLPLPVAPAMRTQLQVGANVAPARIEQVAARAGAAPVVVILAAWAEALRGWLGHDSLTLGTTMSLRGLPTLVDMPGPVFNYVPLRIVRQLDPLVGARDALGWARLGRAVPLARLPGHDPAGVQLGLNANFNYYDVARAMGASRTGRLGAGETVQVGGMTVRQLPIAELPVVRPYDLNLSALRSHAGVRLGLRFRADLFGAEDAHALLADTLRRLG